VGLCFHLLTMQQNIFRLLDDGTYDMPKHVGDLVTFDLYIFRARKAGFQKLTFMHSTERIFITCDTRIHDHRWPHFTIFI
jgi:hypothetical protein